MNEYIPLIMAAAFLTVLSVAIRLITGKSVHKKDNKQHELEFPAIQNVKVEEAHPEVVGGRR